MTPNKRPVIVLERTQTDKILDGLSLLLLILVFAGSIYSVIQLPQIIPIHFDASGHPDAQGDKRTLLILPMIALLVFLMISFLNKHPEWFNYPVQITENNAAAQYRNACLMMRILKLCIMLIFLIIVACSYLAGSGKISRLPDGIMIMILSLTFGPVIFYLAKSFKKS